ncbi:MAG: tRNA (N(6)-L-threonylcarbamoyladenosine(37)-C(2))-methylthiotransferase MtaB, partial [Anaerolineae bacterium]
KRSTLQGYVGRTLPVLVESPGDDGWSGYTPNFLRVSLDAPANTPLENRIVEVRLSGVAEDRTLLLGSIPENFH